MRLNTQSAKSLIYLAIILLLIGGMLGAPVVSALAFGLAAICAVLPALFAQGRMRFVAAVIALLAAYAAVATSLEGDPAYDAYVSARGKASAGAGETGAPLPREPR